MIRRPPRSTRVRSSAASDVYKRQAQHRLRGETDDAGRALAGGPAAGRPRPAGVDFVPGVAGGRRAVETAGHPSPGAAGAAGRLDGGAQHVGFAAGADEGRHVAEELEELVAVALAGSVA